MWNFGIQRSAHAHRAPSTSPMSEPRARTCSAPSISTRRFPGPNTIIGTGVPASISGLTANRVFSTLGCTQFSTTATLSSTGGPVCIAGPLAAIQAINERGSTGYSNYNSLQVRYTKRLSHGLETLLSYTWSKEIDDMTVFVPLLNQDQFNRALGNASAPDVPHLFIGSFVYELPFGKGRGYEQRLPPGGFAVGRMAGQRDHDDPARRAAGGHRRHRQQRRPELGLQ